MILPDHAIRRLCQGSVPMIAPFEPMYVRHNGDNAVSYGLSHAGYDARLANEFLVPSDTNWGEMDPKHPQEAVFQRHYVPDGERFVIAPHSFILARTKEYFRIPRHLVADCLGKSTYARIGILVNVTPLEPEWEGHVTLEISNTAPRPAVIYAGEGICQFRFFRTDGVCDVSYKDKGGKYQGQMDVTLAKV